MSTSVRWELFVLCHIQYSSFTFKFDTHEPCNIYKKAAYDQRHQTTEMHECAARQVIVWVSQECMVVFNSNADTTIYIESTDECVGTQVLILTLEIWSRAYSFTYNPWFYPDTTANHFLITLQVWPLVLLNFSFHAVVTNHQDVPVLSSCTHKHTHTHTHTHLGESVKEFVIMLPRALLDLAPKISIQLLLLNFTCARWWEK